MARNGTAFGSWIEQAWYVILDGVGWKSLPFFRGLIFFLACLFCLVFLGLRIHDQDDRTALRNIFSRMFEFPITSASAINKINIISANVWLFPGKFFKRIPVHIGVDGYRLIIGVKKVDQQNTIILEPSSIISSSYPPSFHTSLTIMTSQITATCYSWRHQHQQRHLSSPIRICLLFSQRIRMKRSKRPPSF